MSERIVQFGERRRLAGTLSLPDGSAHALGFVLLNAGVISRVGPQRLNVQLARALAGAGHAVLRFDLSGLGESAAASGTASFEQQAIADTIAAMDVLARETGVTRCVLFGLCSGADNAYASALVDERVHGLILLDPFAYATVESRLRAYGLRLLLPGAVGALGRGFKAFARRCVRRLQHPLGTSGVDPAAECHRNTPSRQEFARQLAGMTQRGVAVYLMYSGSVSSDYNSPHQFERTFGRELARRVEAEFQPQVNHTRSELAAQRDLIERVLGWTKRKFG